MATESDDVYLVAPGGVVSGDLSGVISPLLTIDRIAYPFSDLSLDFDIGTAQIPVTLNLSGFFGWTSLNPNTVTLAERLTFQSGFADAGRFVGTLATPFGDLPFDVGVAEASAATAALRQCSRNTCATNTRPDLYFDAIDMVAIDSRRSSDWDGYAVTAPFTLPIGEIGGVAWSVGVEVSFDATTYAVVPEPSTGLLLAAGLVVMAVGRGRRI